MVVLKYKVVLVGDASVGKTSLINRVINETFQNGQPPTVGIDFVSKNVFVNDQPVRLQIWDTAGQERFRTLIPTYLRDIQAAVLVYDLTNQLSFQNLEGWLRDVRQYNDPEQIGVIVVGSKLDLIEEQPDRRAVPQEEALQMAQTHNLMYIEASAKTSTNVSAIFQMISCHLMGLQLDQTNFSNLGNQPIPIKDQIQLDIHKQPKHKKCC